MLATDPALATEFRKKMQRFLPSELVSQTVEQDVFWNFLTHLMQDFSAQIKQTLHAGKADSGFRMWFKTGEKMFKLNSTLNTKVFISLLLAVLSGVAITSPASAQEPKVERQAIRCSAFFQVLSDSAEARNFSNLFADAYMKERNDKSVATSGAEIELRREQVLQELNNTFESNQAALMEEAILCGAWAEGYRLQGESPTYIPIIPKIIPQQVRETYAALASAGFKKWLSSKPDVR